MKIMHGGFKTEEVVVNYLKILPLMSLDWLTDWLTGKQQNLCRDISVVALAPHHEGVLGEWRYSSTHSLTSALDGGELYEPRSFQIQVTASPVWKDARLFKMHSSFIALKTFVPACEVFTLAIVIQSRNHLFHKPISQTRYNI